MPDQPHNRSVQLLRRHLTPEQLMTFDVTNGFFCLGSSSRSKYFVRFGRKVVDEKGIEYCIVPRSIGDIPEPDAMLAKKLLIETDERTFLETAIPDRWTEEHYAYRRRHNVITNFGLCFNMMAFVLMIMWIFHIFMRAP